MSMTRFLRRRIWGLSFVIVLTFALDQASKYWLLNTLGMEHRPPIRLCDYFDLVMVWNKGISFGILSHSGDDLTVYALVLVALVIALVLMSCALASQRRWERIAYGMVIGGALGNACDRLRFGAVADFFYAHIGTLGWPAFNVADSAICIGVGLLLIHQFLPSKVGE